MSDFFPKDIIGEILLRLPTNCLIKCTLVCKSWRCLIKTSTFIHDKLRRTIKPKDPQDDAVGLLFLWASNLYGNTAVYSLRWDNSETGEYSNLLNPYPFIREAIFPPSERVVVRKFDVVGTCNGLVCVAIDVAYYGCQIILWNPFVRKFVALPKSSVSVNKNGRHRASYAFGFDSRMNDYKVLRSMSNDNEKPSCEVDVWSLVRGGDWKSLSTDVIPEDFMFGVFDKLVYVPGDNSWPVDKYAFVNGALHWVQQRKISEEKIILGFDIGSESFGEIMMPRGLKKKNCFGLRYEESLALLNFGEQMMGMSSDMDIWVMKEYGVVESWTKLFTVLIQGRTQEALCFKRSGELVFKMRGQRLRMVDIKTSEVKDFEIDGCKCLFMDFFVESLVLLDQADAICY